MPKCRTQQQTQMNFNNTDPNHNRHYTSLQRHFFDNINNQLPGHDEESGKISLRIWRSDWHGD